MIDGNDITGGDELPSVSVVIPARDAEATIASTLDSVLAQDYGGPVEVIVAVSGDSPATAEVVRREYPTVRVVDNPERTRPNALNAGLRAATGQVVAQCDTHNYLPPEYLTQGVATLRRTGAAGVGGRQRPLASSRFERTVGMAITTQLGAGGASYRMWDREGSADSIYLGVYWRRALDAVDGFEPAMTRGQDAEINWRLRQRGEMVWYNPAMTVFYRPRGSLRALGRQYFDYGRWKLALLKRYPGELRMRHLACPALVAGLAGSALLAVLGALVGAAPGLALALAGALPLPLLYIATLLVGSVVVGIRRGDGAAALLLPAALATMHLSWGVGFFLPARAGPDRRSGNLVRGDGDGDGDGGGLE